MVVLSSKPREEIKAKQSILNNSSVLLQDKRKTRGSHHVFNHRKPEYGEVDRCTSWSFISLNSVKAAEPSSSPLGA